MLPSIHSHPMDQPPQAMEQAGEISGNYAAALVLDAMNVLDSNPEYYEEFGDEAPDWWLKAWGVSDSQNRDGDREVEDPMDRVPVTPPFCPMTPPWGP